MGNDKPIYDRNNDKYTLHDTKHYLSLHFLFICCWKTDGKWDLLLIFHLWIEILCYCIVYARGLMEIWCGNYFNISTRLELTNCGCRMYKIPNFIYVRKVYFGKCFGWIINNIRYRYVYLGKTNVKIRGSMVALVQSVMNLCINLYGKSSIEEYVVCVVNFVKWKWIRQIRVATYIITHKPFQISKKKLQWKIIEMPSTYRL